MVLHPRAATDITQDENLDRDFGSRSSLLSCRRAISRLRAIAGILRRKQQDDQREGGGEPEGDGKEGLDHCVKRPREAPLRRPPRRSSGPEQSNPERKSYAHLAMAPRALLHKLLLMFFLQWPSTTSIPRAVQTPGTHVSPAPSGARGSGACRKRRRVLAARDLTRHAYLITF